MKTESSVDAYIRSYPPEQQKTLLQIRELIRSLVPEAVEEMSYGMPSFNYHGSLIWYAGMKSHYGLYPKGAPIVHFAKELKDYEHSKGAIKFPHNKAIPFELIAKIVKYCVILNLGRAQSKADALAAKKAAKKTAKTSAKESAKKVVTKAESKTAAKAGASSVKKSSKAVAKKVVKKVVKKAVKKAPANVGAGAPKKAVKQIVKKAAKKNTKLSAKSTPKASAVNKRRVQR